MAARIVVHPDADLVAICDLDASRVETIGNQFDIPGRYTDLALMLAAERLDGLIVATPHVAHTAPTLAALAASAHVLVEKPMATRPRMRAPWRQPHSWPPADHGSHIDEFHLIHCPRRDRRA